MARRRSAVGLSIVARQESAAAHVGSTHVCEADANHRGVCDGREHVASATAALTHEHVDREHLLEEVPPLPRAPIALLLVL